MPIGEEVGVPVIDMDDAQHQSGIAFRCAAFYAAGMAHRRPKALPEPPRYREFLAYVFAREELPWDVLDEPDPFAGMTSERPADVVALYQFVFTHLRQDVAGLPVPHIARGLRRLFYPEEGDTVFALRHDAAPLEARCAALRAMGGLYADLFAPHCAAVLLHLSERGGNALNEVCYMLWDATPLNYVRGMAEEEAAATRDAVLAVLSEACRSDHIACVESALHGLGHMAPYHPAEAQKIIDDALQRPGLDPRLRRYAEAARRGLVQ